jgi:predicted transcriptional regulator
MNENDNNLELLSFFKALADANRLKIIGILANQVCTVEQLASMLHLGASTVSHHLSRLSDANLVTAKAEGYYSVYSLDKESLESMSQRLLAREKLPDLAKDVDIEAYDRKVIRDYSNPDGSFKMLPTQRKKLDVVLQYIVKAFAPGIKYKEKEVNEILKKYNEDFAFLRRELCDSHLMERKNGEYWFVTDKI